MWVAVSTPVVGMALGLGVDVTEWVIANQRMQYAADAAANSGALQYGLSANAQQAANAAADVAEANGVPGTARASRVWTGGTVGTLATGTLVDNKVTVVVGTAYSTGDVVSVSVSASKAVMPTFSKVFSNSDKIVKATATADAIAGAPGATYQQPCIFTTGTISDNDIMLSGSGSLNLSGCAVLSNSGIQLSGGAGITAGTIYAEGTIDQNYTTINGVKKEKTGKTYDDPYSNDDRLHEAFGKLTDSDSYAALNVGGVTSTTIAPGVYPSMTIGSSGTVAMQPGLYVVKGAIVVDGAGIVTGNGVSIICGAAMTITAGATVRLAAATTENATFGSIPGVLFASNADDVNTPTLAPALTLSGTVAPTLTGVLYMPKSSINISGGVQSNGTSGCLEIIARTATVIGGAALANAGCPAMGTVPIGPANTPARAGSSKLVM